LGEKWKRPGLATLRIEEVHVKGVGKLSLIPR